MKTTRTLPQAGGTAAGECPICNREIAIRAADMEITKRCPHLVRRWRVDADQRIRAEFCDEVLAPVG